MTREEAIIQLEYRKDFATPDQIEALDMAISALTEELFEDGTLTVHVSDGSKVKRVFVMGDNIFGGLYYPDSAENKGDLISRQAVINAIANTCFWLSADNWEELTKCISSIPSVENKGEWIPVSERLPKEGETVLVCYRTQGGIAQSVCEWFDMPNRGIVWSTLSERKPIAWQPLPEPYKAEKGGK